MRGLQRTRVCLSDLLDLCIMKFSMGHNSVQWVLPLDARKTKNIAQWFRFLRGGKFSVNGFCLGDVRIVTSTYWIFCHVFLWTRRMLLLRDALVSVQEKLRWQVLDGRRCCASSSRSLLSHVELWFMLPHARNVSHFSVGFYYHIAARVTSDRILLSVCYVLTQFHDHVVFGWTWIHTVEVILFIHFWRNFDFRVLRILHWKCCVFLQVLRLSAPRNTLN